LPGPAIGETGFFQIILMALAKTVILISGPTAVGKTAVAIELAKYFKTEIISADSRQCFKELSIGVARPSSEDLKQVQHHFIASHSIHEEVTAASFQEYALKKVNELFQNHQEVVMVGGTGLYIKAFCEGLDKIPFIDPALRDKLTKEYSEKGLVWLQESIKKKDPDYYLEGEMQNPQRMLRALEVIEATGLSIRSFQQGQKAERDFKVVKIGLELPKEELHRNINTRVEAMIKNGLVHEVKSLIAYRHLNALQTVGYKEIFNYLNGEISLPTAIEQIKTSTRQYAKRQMTWFRKDKEVKWFMPGEIKEIIKWVELH